MVFILQANLKPFFSRKLALGPVVGCACCLLLFVWLCSRFYLPGKGFTYLIEFGDREHSRYLPELQAVNHYELKDSAGYDAQWYAQIAMHPRLSDPAIRNSQGALDSLPYRARRILLCWTAYLFAGGNAVWAMHVFSVQNIVCWFAFAVLLWRWLPPTSWDHFFRWAAILYGFGLCCSVRGSLTDGPSLLLIACAAALVETEKLWLAAVVLGVAALARETNLLAGLMLVGGARPRGGRAPLLGLAAVAVAPLVLWIITLHLWLGPALDPGARNLALPFMGYAGKWQEVWAVARAHGFDLVTRGDLLVLVALTVQWLFIVLRPRWSELWWRIAAPYSVLAVFLGDAVWEGYPGAAARVLLPLTAAFNLLVPKRRWWLALLVAGNVSAIVSYDNLNAPGRESSVVTGPRSLRIMPGSGAIVDVSFDGHWSDPEKSLLEYWRWSSGDASVTFHNPHPFAVQADVTFGLRANDDRVVSIRAPGRTLWLGKLEKGKLKEVRISNYTLPPGESLWSFETPTPPVPPGPADSRALAFSLRNLRIALKRSQSPPAAAGTIGQ
jgi:hypothetical protein